jgi:tRNA(Ile)-lysidine synthase TilS/MesJ
VRCDRCGRVAIVLQRYSGLRLCRDHARESIEARARRTIRARGWIRPGDRIAVGLSGGAGSSSLLHFLSAHFGMRPDLTLVAVTVDEGTGPLEMARVRRIAEGMGVPWAGASLAGQSIDTRKGIHAPGGGDLPSPSPPWLRDRALSSLAGRAGATKLALGTSLEDEAGSLFRRVLRGDVSRLVGSPHQPGDGIPRIRPFLRIPEEELSLYARLTVPDHLPSRSRQSADPVERETDRMLSDYTARHPSAMFALVNLAGGLSGKEGSGSREPASCRGCGKLHAPGCPARETHGRVTGRG